MPEMEATKTRYFPQDDLDKFSSKILNDLNSGTVKCNINQSVFVEN